MGDKSNGYVVITHRDMNGVVDCASFDNLADAREYRSAAEKGLLYTNEVMRPDSENPGECFSWDIMDMTYPGEECVGEVTIVPEVRNQSKPYFPMTAQGLKDFFERNSE